MMFWGTVRKLSDRANSSLPLLHSIMGIRYKIHLLLQLQYVRTTSLSLVCLGTTNKKYLQQQ